MSTEHDTIFFELVLFAWNQLKSNDKYLNLLKIFAILQFIEIITQLRQHHNRTI